MQKFKQHSNLLIPVQPVVSTIQLSLLVQLRKHPLDSSNNGLSIFRTRRRRRDVQITA